MMDMEGFINEANETLPEFKGKDWGRSKEYYMDKGWLRAVKINYEIWPYKEDFKWINVEKRLIKDRKGRWRKMPPDDGYDEAFFQIAISPDNTFDYYTLFAKADLLTFYDKVRSCWYVFNLWLFEEFMRGNIKQKDYLKKVREKYTS